MTRRSLLFTPGDRPELLWKAAGSDADVLCFDLEDAVAPDRKAEARAAVADVLADPDFDPDAEVSVRLTAGETAADLDALVTDGPVRLDAVMLPKVETGKRVETVAAMCAERDFDVAVLALIETAEGVLSAREVAGAEPADAVLFGAEDLAADIGATRTAGGTEVLYAREHVVIAASAAGVDAIDTVYTDFSDEGGLREEAAFAVELGYDGKMAIHPAQVPVINDAYTPAPERIEWAESVLDARDAAAADGRGVFQVDGEMIDAPLIAQAERVLERARAAGQR
ncbi:CoA ester lyase [Halorubrum sp. JWXQ-INN 858]|uniref:HpcH/HpaI aldolase/citrate lyase family protein n=1 Tax=Halorubrum sp. JWXQ-INN 858 TaxID=2690782 RepID=UPI001357799F|nr:CoA ester lyase [Halorubrum sp. JWXQ-INN 858]MWV64954.1 CoA ester lyase [Halorubrum sp. JWXQ-INN 858]